LFNQVQIPARRYPMCHDSDGDEHDRRWTFSLKGLMFLTLVVAVCSAIVGAAPAAAVIFVPLTVAALLRTMRVRQRMAAVEHECGGRRGLFATFCQSLALITFLLIVLTAAFLSACGAGILIALGAASRLSHPLVMVLRRLVVRAWHVGATVWNSVRMRTRGLTLADVFGVVRSYAIRATVLLFSASRLLVRRCWYPSVDESQRLALLCGAAAK
jgi:hypothetical protein